MVYTSEYSSPFGKMTVASDGENITGLWIEGQKHFLSTVKGKPENGENLTAIISAKAWLDRYFAGEKPETSALPLAPSGTEFKKEVWNILLTIPYGETASYWEIAKRLAAKRGIPKMSARAVGNAVARNPVSIIIPCHRVISSDGSLTGYAGGLPLKIRLLEHEGVKLLANDNWRVANYASDESQSK